MPRAALLETMEEVKRQLGITDPVLYSAVKAANGMMGLAADGTLPQQVHKLAAALGLSRHTVHEVCGDSIDFDPPTRAIVEDLQQSMEPFFLIPDLSRRSSAERTWRDLIGDRVICLEHADDTCMVAAALVALNEGLLTLDGVARQVAAHAPERVGRIARALMPFAASLGRDDAPPLRPDPRTTPGNESTRTSQMKRISS